MKLFRKAAQVLSAALLAASINLPATAKAQEDVSYTPSEANLKAREAFADARFGIFIHWGIYSMIGHGEWVMQNENISYKE